MSRRTFYREFRASTGTTPCHRLLAQRLLLARRLLENTQLTIEEVARHSGFGDASRLRKHFTAQVRLTPTAYRRTFGHPIKALPAPDRPLNPAPGTLTSDCIGAITPRRLT